MIDYSYWNNKLKRKGNKVDVKCPMWRTAPLVARKWKFAMKLVKNCIKTWQFWNEYQSIISDVDQHQRECDSNPNRHQTLTLNDEKDEHKFLSHFNTSDVRESLVTEKHLQENTKIVDFNPNPTETEEQSAEEEEEESEEDHKENESEGNEHKEEVKQKINNPK